MIARRSSPAAIAPTITAAGVHFPPTNRRTVPSTSHFNDVNGSKTNGMPEWYDNNDEKVPACGFGTRRYARAYMLKAPPAEIAVYTPAFFANSRGDRLQRSASATG